VSSSISPASSGAKSPKIAGGRLSAMYLASRSSPGAPAGSAAQAAVAQCALGRVTLVK
jgi:hypothetical protein